MLRTLEPRLESLHSFWGFNKNRDIFDEIYVIKLVAVVGVFVKEILDVTIRVSLLLPPFSPLPYFFPILFGGNTTKKAPVSALRRCHGDFRFHINHFCCLDGQER